MIGQEQTPGNPEGQAAVIAFLRDPASYPSRPAAVKVIETHAALVFLAGNDAFKIKRAVKLPYLDFSMLALREQVCRREIEINRPNAPSLYLGLIAITREPNGEFAFNGNGSIVEWAVHMARFGQEALLASIAETSGIDDGLARDLARTVGQAHIAATRHCIGNASERLQRVIDGVSRSIDETTSTEVFGDRHVLFQRAARRQLNRVRALLDRRGRDGFVRRCHGDLHLGNIVLWNRQPTLFDALEFDEDLATIDVLYDLAFLLMDLQRRGEARAATIVLNLYLGGSANGGDYQGLAALPLFLGLRAAIRAMVAIERSHHQTHCEANATLAHARDTLDRALSLLSPPAPRIVAIGGLSGTGKTTLATGLAPYLKPQPGAVHLRSDVVRKRLAGVSELERLPADAYTSAAAEKVYRRLAADARLVVGAGHSVIVDAVFAGPEERRMIEAVAKDCQVRFDGIWLEADATTLKARVAARRDDASDATPDVVERQLGYDTGVMTWRRLPTGDSRDAALSRALLVLDLATDQ